MSGGAGSENIGDFYADLIINFDFEAQLSKINDQLREFSSRLIPITVPIRVIPPGKEAMEIASMGFSDPLSKSYSGSSRGSRSRLNGLTELQFENMTTRDMLRQGYAQGDGGWYKPAEKGASFAGGMGMSMLGFGAGMAAFTAAFAVIGDLEKGAQLNRQLAVLKEIIPQQQQYNATLQNIVNTANQTGLALQPLAHSFTAFAISAKLSNVSMAQTTETFDALTKAISGTGSSGQSNRIMADFTHLFLNSQNVSLSRMSRTDLGYYLKLPALLMNLPEFKGMSEEEVGKKLSAMPISQRLQEADKALAPYGALSTASANTLSGRFAVFQNELVLLGATLTNTVTPPLKLFLDVLSDLAAALNVIVGHFNTDIGQAGIKGAIAANSPIGFLPKKYQTDLFSNMASTVRSFAQGAPSHQPQTIHLVIDNKNNSSVKASPSKPSASSGLTMARTR